MEWITIFANYGLPAVILGFILWFFVRPVFQAYTKNIEKQTDVLERILSSCQEGKDKLVILDKRVEHIDNKVEHIDNKITEIELKTK